MGVAAAVLQRDRGRWRLVGDAGRCAGAARPLNPVAGLSDADGVAWTGVAMGAAGEWVVVVPGSQADWTARPDLEEILGDVAQELSSVSRLESSEYLRRAGTGAYRLGHRLARISDAGRMHEAIIRAMTSCVDAHSGALALFARHEGALRIAATCGYPHAIVEHIRVQPGEGILGQVFATGRPILIGGDAPDVALPHRRRYRTQSCIVVPLKTSTEVFAVAAVSDPRAGEYFEPIDLRALRLFGPPAVLALQRERLREDIAEVTRSAVIDPVTGLANRQYLQTRLDAEMQRAKRLRQSLAIMLVDVDDFKNVNDTWGHLEGDRVLRDIAALLAEHVRIFDVCTRYGGEEFVILMPGADREMAVRVAERVRKAVELAYRDGRSGVHITLSAGVALLDPGDTPDTLLGRADQALLSAKGEGKNAVKFV
jgi:diguanylate cyclase (GGDEF)-like protein